MGDLVIVCGPKGHVWHGAHILETERAQNHVVTSLGTFRRDRYGTLRLETDPAFHIEEDPEAEQT
ncbi:hypothetical protein [Salipiger sp. PrR007]|uniref:hypothetical protein n=1 Tax=Salipiger sp. PrR007 TaxID=2706884 RepID=UPI0013BC3B1C|nr:hypothetical protein [Salipiger sp. PrR007]NDW34671.1 hypothetical protein [Salipiger sp. PrR007]